MSRFQNVPTSMDFAAGRVTNPASSEVIRQRLYDYQLYPTAGSTQLTFFALPIGQGIATAPGSAVGSAKTIHDTNLTQASTLPSGLAFIVESIEVAFFPGKSAAANTFTPADIAVFAAVAAQAVEGAANDVNAFYTGGLLRFKILQKDYLIETPLKAFPSKTHIRADASTASNSATTAEVGTIIARAEGRPYIVDPIITLQPAVNFSVTLEWPGVVATPSGFNGRVGVILDGYQQRAGQ